MIALTDLERQTLAELSEDWRVAPACYRPNPRAIELRKRGLMEWQITSGDFYQLRRTPLATAALAEGARR